MTVDPPLDEILDRACRAPSVHNTQPWRWRARANQVDLFADLGRQLVHADPDARDLMISCGAALHHLQVAAAGLGWATRVSRLPHASDQQHIARVVLSATPPSPEAAELLEALGRRCTDRRRPTSWPVPSERLPLLASTGTAWGAQVLPVTSDARKAQLRRLTDRARRVQERDPRYVAEIAAWTSPSPSHGVPRTHVPRAMAHAGKGSPYGRFPSGVLDDPILETEPSEDAMLLVCTSSDDAIARVRAGEALSALWLKATQEGLSVVPLTQAVEVEETRRELREDVLGELAFPQAVVRVCWLPAAREGLPPTPRRPREEVVTYE